jgi:hypothetical protein
MYTGQVRFGKIIRLLVEHEDAVEQSAGIHTGLRLWADQELAT